MARAGHARGRKLAALLTACALVGAGVGSAIAYWTIGSPLEGNGAATAASVNQGATPTVSSFGSANVRVDWGATMLSNGRPVDGYLVKRYPAAGGAAEAIGSSCGGTVTATTCTETGIATGSWRYTITPVIGDNWRGAESALSGAVSTAPAQLHLDQTLFGPAMPTTTTGTVSGFEPNEGLSYRLDSATPLTGSPSSVGADGTATITSLAIPSETGEGSHTVWALGDGTPATQASSGIVVDKTGPTMNAFVTPAPNAAGWNNVSPVQATGAADDGTGSGIAYVKYTSDGSDPKTSPTAQIVSGPVPVSVTTTLKLFAADNAGNESAVQTLPVKIDTAAPALSLSLTGVSGGAYDDDAGDRTFYRGVAVGAYSYRATVTDGGSGPASSGTTTLTGTSTGFTHNSSTVTTPSGGPYDSSAYSWLAGTASGPATTVTGSDAADNTTTKARTLVNDSTAPAGGSVDATGLGGADGRHASSLTLDLSLAKGTDSGSGLAASGSQLLRAAAPLGEATATCGSYGSYAQVGADDPPSSTTNVLPADDRCYRFQYTVPDNVGNVATYTSPDIKLDTIPAADFLQPVTSPESVRLGPAGIDTGDVDNDGDKDIVVASIFDATFSVLVNNGVGRFSEKYVLANAATIDVGLGTFDGDSNLDLVALYPGAPPGTGLLVIFKGNGDGTFSFLNNVGELVGTGVRPNALAVGNFNGDAIDDVAVLDQENDPNTQNGTVITYIGNPAADDSFSVAGAQTLSAQLGATDIAYADFNGGAKDLVVSNNISNSVTFMAGNGTGFNAPVNVAAGAKMLFLDTADLNADGNRDIVASIGASSPSAVRTLFGDGAGGFGSQATTTAATAATGTAPQGIVAKDFTNDGIADVALANSSPSTVSVLNNNGAGGLSIAPSSPETGIGADGTLPWRMASNDFDGNGFNDLVVGPVFAATGEGRILLNQSGPRANLSVSASDAPDPVSSGENVTYSVTVTNADLNTPSSVKVSDALPTGTSFDAAASSPTCTTTGISTIREIVTCDYGSVANGAPETQQIALTTNSAAASSLSNTLTVAGNLADPTPSNNADTVSTTVNPSEGPTQAFSLNTPVNAYLGGTTLYFKGNAAGSFKLVDTETDPQGPASAHFPDIATPGWTHAAETVTAPVGGPYTSSTFSWIANVPAVPQGYLVTARDTASNRSIAPITFVNDPTPPSGGSVNYTNGDVTSLSVPVTTANGADGQSGVNAGSGVVKRAQATLDTTTRTCGTFGSFSTTINLVGGNDTSVASGNCYQYQYLVSDNVGNQATYSSTNVAKVDTSGPRVTAIASQQSSGAAGNGQLEVGDRLILTFNQNLSAASVPATFTGATETSPGLGVNVTLNIPGFSSGARDTGSPNYLLLFGTTATFSGTAALINNGTSTTVTLTVTTLGGGLTAASSGVLVFAPAGTITDGGGNAATGTFSTPSAFQLF